MTEIKRSVHVVLLVWLLATSSAFPSFALGQDLVSERAFAGTVEMYVIRPGQGVAGQEYGARLTTSRAAASIVIAPKGSTPISSAYRFIEFPSGTSSMALLFRDPAAPSGLFPGVMLGLARLRSAGVSLQCLGWISGEDAIGPYWGPVFARLQEITPAPPSVPPAPPVATPPATLPAFDGATLRVPAAWKVRKFEGWALRLARKYGTLPGGTTAAVPVDWLDGVMQCHGEQGFIYEIPLIFTYAGFPNGAILYTPVGTWPNWENRARWKVIAQAGGYTKHVFR